MCTYIKSINDDLKFSKSKVIKILKNCELDEKM